MEHLWSGPGWAGTSAPAASGGPAPGKSVRTRNLQRAARGAAPAPSGEASHQAAAAGVSSTPGSMPFLAEITGSFGPEHDVSAIGAHVGGAATGACRTLGARAYAYGDQVAFAGTPDLHTAAHEAAHVVQQRGGVQLAGGVGQSGDRYEQHADAVADAVVAGRSAAPLLAGLGGAAGAPAVQRQDGDATTTGGGDADAAAGDAAGADAAGGEPRANYAFIMVDSDDKVARYGRTYFENQQAGLPDGDTFEIVTDGHADIDSFDEIVDYIHARASDMSGDKPIRNIWILVHGSRQHMGMKMEDTSAAGDKASYSKIAEYNRAQTRGKWVGHHGVDATTRIRIIGCNIGGTDVFPEEIDQAFGGAGTVVSSTHTLTVDSKGELYLSEPHFYAPGDMKSYFRDKDNLLDALAAKYPHLTRDQWKQKVKKAGNPDIEVTREYLVVWGYDENADLDALQTDGDATLATMVPDPETYETEVVLAEVKPGTATVKKELDEPGKTKPEKLAWVLAATRTHVEFEDLALDDADGDHIPLDETDGAGKDYIHETDGVKESLSGTHVGGDDD